MSIEVAAIVAELTAAMDAKCCQVQEYEKTRTHDRSVYFDIYSDGQTKTYRLHEDDPHKRLFCEDSRVIVDPIIPKGLPSWSIDSDDREALESLVQRAREAPRVIVELAPYLHVGTIVEIRATIGG